jgi:hypothetical protein
VPRMTAKVAEEMSVFFMPRGLSFLRRGRKMILMQFLDPQTVRFGAVARRFLTALQRFGNGFERHALLCQSMEFLNLVTRPRLTVAFKAFGHEISLSSC